MSAPAIELRSVEKRFGSVVAVRSFDLSVRQGEFVALLGPSGCGKTTSLRMIAGLDQPTRGEIFVKGALINHLPVHRRNIGMVFQNHALFPHKSAFDNIAFGLKYRHVPKSEIERRVRAALDLVRLPNVGDRLPAQLSGGQQQRIALARAVVIEPDLLLFDEPLSSLDAALREEMRIELKRIQRTLGITAVFVTHDQAEALSMADKVVVMRDGRKEQEGTPEEVYRRPANEFVTRFFGSVNEIEGVAAPATDGHVEVRLGDGVCIRLPGPGAPAGKVRLLVRAERVRVLPAGATSQADTALAGTIASSDYLGMLVRYFVVAHGLKLQAVQPLDGSPLRNGEPVAVVIRPTDWIFAPPAAQ